MAHRNEAINVRLTEKRKRRWKDAAEERGRSLSEFIRWCVEVELRDEKNSSGSDTRETREVDNVLEELQSLSATLDGGPGSVLHRLQAIEGQLSDDPNARQLVSTVYGLLPEEGQLEEITTGLHPAEYVSENSRVVSGRPEHIATYIEWDPNIEGSPDSEEVKYALTELVEDMNNVHQLNDGRYYRT